MNREIRFRGKRVDNNNWVFGYFYEECGSTYIFEDKQKQMRSELYRNCPFKVNPETIGQFTGLLDKYGKEIYEGDIVVFIFENGTESLPYLVFFEDGSWWVNNSQTKQYDHLYHNLHNIKVIGNIHENPELLETEVES